MTTEDTARQLHEELETATAAVQEHARISARLARAETVEASAHQAVVDAQLRLTSESADVRRLESYSPTRIWATLRGHRDTELERERAEEQAAEYAVARAQSWLLTTHQETERARAELARLGDVDTRREQALRAKEEWLLARPGSAAEELARIADELAAAQTELREVQEAAAAGEEAAARLYAAGQKLGAAGDWATYDTFLGGGMFSDAMKYDRMDEAQGLLHAADQALRRLAAELADVGISATVRGLSVDGLTRTFDVFFDNIFSDWAVRDRIQQAARQTAGASQVVHDVRLRLAERERALRQRTEALRNDRERVLSAS